MSFGTRYLAPQVARFMVEHPALEVRLDLNDRRVDLLEEGYDLAIRIGSLPDSSLVARRLTRCRLLLCAAPGYLAEHGEPDSLAALDHHRCLRYRSGHGTTDWQFGGRIVQQPSFLITDSLRSGRLVPILTEEAPIFLDIHGIYPVRRHLPAKVERFLDGLAAAWGEPPIWERELGL
ncbi:substrate binding domain-containing protein [Halomonas sp. BM-2019]|uniref:substrate binding domain-containing protein n=1 Tax=Halomonas sp. BM-2019 TaxID=2811227 RepID=UPI0031FCAB23